MADRGWLVALTLASVALGCACALSVGCGQSLSTAPNAQHKDAGTHHSKDAASSDGLEVLIGTPDPVNGLDFVPLEAGGDIPLETFGQGGTHASLAIRFIGFGSEAFVDVSVENPAEGTRVMTVPTVRAQLFPCDPDDPRVCDAAPIHVMTGGLADPDKKDGLAVQVIAVVHNTTGATGTGMQDGVLRKNF